MIIILINNMISENNQVAQPLEQISANQRLLETLQLDMKCVVWNVYWFYRRCYTDEHMGQCHEQTISEQ